MNIFNYLPDLLNGSPCYIGNRIGRSAKDMSNRLKKGASHFPIFTLFNAKQIKYWIGLEPSMTPKGPQVKTTEPMVSIKVFSKPFNRLKCN